MILLEHMSAKNENLQQLERLCLSGQPVKARAHPTFKALIEVQRLADSDLVVARRRVIVHELGSGALRSIMLESITPAGIVALEQNQETPVAGFADILINAERPYEGGPTGMIETQQTRLRFDFKTSGSTSMILGGTLPFDEIMERETREEWLRWGVALEYRVDERFYGGTTHQDWPAPLTATLTAME